MTAAREVEEAMSEDKRSHKTEIIVAVIGLTGILGAAVITSLSSSGPEPVPDPVASTSWIIGDPDSGLLFPAKGLFETRADCMAYFVSDSTSSRVLGDRCMEVQGIAYCFAYYDVRDAGRASYCFQDKDSCEEAMEFEKDLFDAGQLEFFLTCEEMPLDEAVTLG